MIIKTSVFVVRHNEQAVTEQIRRLQLVINLANENLTAADIGWGLVVFGDRDGRKAGERGLDKCDLGKTVICYIGIKPIDRIVYRYYIRIIQSKSLEHTAC